MGNKILSWLFTISIICCVISVGFIIRLKYYYYLPYKHDDNILNFKIDYTRPNNINYNNIKDDIDKLFNYPQYTFNITHMSSTGNTNLLTSVITLNNNLSYETFVFTLAHELVHLTYFTVDERFCNFTAWKILYESNNQYFQNIALAFTANSNYVSSDYHFAAYVIDYLK